MNSETAREKDSGLVLLWVWFALILLYFLFGSAVSVRHSDLPVAFSEAVHSIALAKSMGSLDEWASTIGVAIVVCVLYSFIRNSTVRLCLMITGLLVTALLIEFELAMVLLVYGPACTFAPFIGATGEWYVEGGPMATAAGWWLVLCIVYAIRCGRQSYAAHQRWMCE